MKTVPFLNEKGEIVGTATISDDGSTAQITIDLGSNAVAELLSESGISLGYVFASGDKEPLKNSERRYFVAQKVKP